MKKVCMINEGVNEAPALKTAYVSVAMGFVGSDGAIEVADIALLGDDIGKISYLKNCPIPYYLLLKQTLQFL